MYLKSFIIFLKGSAMGLADLIPGISGGTIALILGIYKKFINSLKSINLQSIKLLFTFNFKELNKQLNLVFLIPLFSGIIFSVLVFSSLIFFFLEEFSIHLYSIFFGLIFFSSLYLIKKTSSNFLSKTVLILIGIGIGYILSILNPFYISDTYMSIYLSGLIAMLAMLLPGISGSYILVLLGKYKIVLEALNNFNFDILIFFLLGSISGILLFSRFISLLLSNYYNATILVLSGLMIGALNKIWPWKYNNFNISPNDYHNLTGSADYFYHAFIIFILCGLFSLMINYKKYE